MATEGTGADAARELGVGWKVSPCIHIPGSTTVTLADIDGSGAIQQLWFTVEPKYWRALILRIYWDDEVMPSVEVPLGDFFCMGWCERCQRQVVAHRGQSGRRLQLLLGDAIPQPCQDHS